MGLIKQPSNLVSERLRPKHETNYNPFTNATFESQSLATTNDLKAASDALEGSFELCFKGKNLQMFSDMGCRTPTDKQKATKKSKIA